VPAGTRVKNSKDLPIFTWNYYRPTAPELNPTEHLWDYIREQKGFNNCSFHSLDQLEDHLEEVLKNLNQEKEYIKSLCTFNWMITTF
jgi:hypothetical protein